MACRIGGSASPEEQTRLLTGFEGSIIETGITTIPRGITLDKARRLLYISHFFNQFSDKAWQFCLILFLAALSNYQSLFLVSSYGLVSESAVCLFGSTAGKFVDGTNRLEVAQIFLLLENCAVVLATICCWFLLTRTVDEQSNSLGVPTDTFSIFLILSVHFLGALARILDSGFLVAIERDWVVIMSSCATDGAGMDPMEQTRQQKAWLSTTNVTMRQIDLTCKVVAPAISGFIVAFHEDDAGKENGLYLREAAMFVGGINSISLVVEYVCTLQIYNGLPSLWVKPPKSVPEPLVSVDLSECASILEPAKKPTWMSILPLGLQVYFSQEIAGAGVALSLLYLNVLTFGGIMTAYLVWKGMKLHSVGVWRGISSAVGLLGTLVFRVLSTRLGLLETGMLSVTFQCLCLTATYLSLFVDDLHLSTGLLVGGVCASRVGLWVFDISVTQLMQLHVPESVRGLVGGVQQSLNSFFCLLSFALGLVYSNPRDFHILVAAGYFCVIFAVVCFGLEAYVKRHQLQFF